MQSKRRRRLAGAGNPKVALWRVQSRLSPLDAVQCGAGSEEKKRDPPYGNHPMFSGPPYAPMSGAWELTRP